MLDLRAPSRVLRAAASYRLRARLLGCLPGSRIEADRRRFAERRLLLDFAWYESINLPRAWALTLGRPSSRSRSSIWSHPIATSPIARPGYNFVAEHEHAATTTYGTGSRASPPPASTTTSASPVCAVVARSCRSKCLAPMAAAHRTPGRALPGRPHTVQIINLSVYANEDSPALDAAIAKRDCAGVRRDRCRQLRLEQPGEGWLPYHERARFASWREREQRALLLVESRLVGRHRLAASAAMNKGAFLWTAGRRFVARRRNVAGLMLSMNLAHAERPKSLIDRRALRLLKP